MEIVTYDDVESVKFIHGPKFRVENNKGTRILICNQLEYLIFLKEAQIFINDINKILKRPDNFTYFEADLAEIECSCLRILDVPKPFLNISHIILDYSSTILTVVTDQKIFLYDLKNLEKHSDWKSIKHNGIKSINWTKKNDLVFVESNGNCNLYHYDSLYADFVQFQLVLNEENKFKFIEDCRTSINDILFILVTEDNKSVVFITQQLYNQILFSESNTFVIPDTFRHFLNVIIEPVKDTIFSTHIEPVVTNFLDHFHIACVKFLSTELLDYFLIVLVGGLEYIDGYVLFFSISNDLKVNICSYSINDLSFDNIEFGHSEQLDKVSCSAIWIKEWDILFIGSPFFSQMIIFTCNNTYINMDSSHCSSSSTKWLRLGMSEGYDINCTDFDVGIFDAGICTCYNNTVKDPKSTMDSLPLEGPPLIFISQTNGDLVVHYIGGTFKFRKLDSVHAEIIPINFQLLKNSITPKEKNDSSCFFNNFSNEHDLIKNLNKSSSELDSTKKETGKEINQQLVLESPKNIVELSASDIKTMLFGIEFKIKDKSGVNLFDSLLKIEEEVINIENKFNELFFSSEEIKKISGDYFLQNIDQFIEKYVPNYTQDKFETLLLKYNEIIDSERQLKKLYFGMMKKVSEEIYKNTNLENIKDKFRKNELTSNQISILFELNNQEESELFKYSDMHGVQEICESLVLTERQCLKLASRISQISKFSQKLNLKLVQDPDIMPLPPSATEHMTAFSGRKFSYSVTPDLVFVDNDVGNQLSFSGNEISSSVKIISNSEKSPLQYERMGNLGYSPNIKKINHISEVISNISHSISPKREVLRSSIGSFDELNFSGSSNRNSTFLFKNTQSSLSTFSDRYSKLRSKIVRFPAGDSPMKDNLSNFSKFNLKQINIPYFSLKWKPNLTDEDIPTYCFKSPKYIENLSNSAKTFLNPISSTPNSNDVINSSFRTCHERLERIIDYCDMIQESILFIERENLIPRNIHWRNLRLYSNPSKYIDRQLNDKLINSHLVLSRNSTTQKNILYRQKLSLILSDCLVDSFKKDEFKEILPCFGTSSDQDGNSDFLNSSFNKIDIKSKTKNISILSDFKDNSIKIDNLKNFNNFNDNNKDFSGNTQNMKQVNMKDPNCNNCSAESKTCSKLNYENLFTFINEKKCSELSDSVDSPSTNTKFDKGENHIFNKKQSECNNTFTLSNCSLDLHENMNKESPKIEFEQNNVNESQKINNSNRVDSTTEKLFNEAESKNIFENNGIRDSLSIEKSITSLFPVTVNETPNSKKASEGLFTFSTEMNTSLNLVKTFSEKNKMEEQPSNDSNIFSFSSDNNPLKPINNPYSLINSNSRNKQSLSNELNKMNETAGSTLNSNKINKEIAETKKFDFIDETSNSQDLSLASLANTGEFKGTSNSFIANNLGTSICNLNLVINSSPAPKTSGFGSSQFLTTGPFSMGIGREVEKSDSTSSSREIFNISDLGPSHQNYSFGISSPQLNNSTPFVSHPVVKNQIGGFTSLSQQFNGFSSTSISNFADGSFNTLSNNQFSFAPPPKPRQVNKLD